MRRPRRTAYRFLVPAAVAAVLLATLVSAVRPAPPPSPSGFPALPQPGRTPPAPAASTTPAPLVTSGPPCTGTAEGATWRPIAAPGPPARALHVAAFDPLRGQALVFGGVGADGAVLGDLWSFSLPGERWEEVEVAIDGDRPTPRWAAAALHDPARDRLLLFFGDAAPATDEVWALDLAPRRWALLGAGNGGDRPPARYDAAVGGDGFDRAWIYGGFAGPQFSPNTALRDLWELDLATGAWRPLPSGGAPPPPTTNAALAFHDGALYLVGGHDATGVTPGYWRYSLASGEWQPLPATVRPAAWTHHARAVDPACADLLLLGGDDADGADVASLEAFRMGAAPALARLPGAVAEVSRHHAAMAFDPVTRHLVLFGGWRGPQLFLGDTWIYPLGSGAPAPAQPAAP